ncbi:hypothetical protein M8H82_11790 [Streptomyces sp. YS415]|nr:hypothetical protein [Streptomyces sp. YS415]
MPPHRPPGHDHGRPRRPARDDPPPGLPPPARPARPRPRPHGAKRPVRPLRPGHRRGGTHRPGRGDRPPVLKERRLPRHGARPARRALSASFRVWHDRCSCHSRPWTSAVKEARCATGCCGSRRPRRSSWRP